jgi:hypothetical protein
MEKRTGRNNARSLFGIKQIPSTAQIRNLLDSIDEGLLGGLFWAIYHKLSVCGQLV